MSRFGKAEKGSWIANMGEGFSSVPIIEKGSRIMAKPFFFSKSRYTEFWQCPKMAWLRKYHPEERVIDEHMQQLFAVGDEVGDLAMGLFGDFVEVTAYKDDGLDLERMIEATCEELEKGTPVICEASFSLNGLYCAVDILRREGEGWAIYEVKSSTHPEKAVYAADVAYQKHVLEGCGVTVVGTYLVCLDKEYVLDGELDLSGLFLITDISDAVAVESTSVAANIELARRLLESEEEPDIGLSECCKDPYLCGFWDYCTRDLPHPNVFDLYRLSFKKGVDFYQRGAVSYRDLVADPVITNEKHLRQIEHALSDVPDHVDAGSIRTFLDRLSYPLYFLDFETMMPAVPRYQGTKPYAQVPFQYSLHIIGREGGELEHREFLAEPEDDPRRAIAERLCEDIPADACVLAYNKVFECGRLKELAEQFPDLADHLLCIERNVVDLLVPFQSGWYYNRAMGGSFSIKSVLPALFPDDPELDYSNLEGVHNGSEAMTVFPAMAGMNPEERAATRRSLLEYCKLDTYAMVKIWQRLQEVAG